MPAPGDHLRKISSRVLLKHNPLPEKPTFRQRLWHKCLCPPHTALGNLLSRALICLLVWLAGFSLVREDALPGGNVFALFVLVIAAMLGGFLVSLIKLPPLLGMLIMGCLLRNIPVVNYAKDISPTWSSILRNVALTVILTRAGLGLDSRALRKLSKSVLLLAFLPCAAEAGIVGLAAYFILSFPWLWAFLLGFVQAAVSPAVVVPFMLRLQETRLGTNKGIPTLLMAASSLDDVLAISGYSVLLSSIFARTDTALWFQIIQGPLEILVGLLYGCVIGIIFWYLPHRGHEDVGLFRFLFLFLGGLVSIIGSKAVGFSGAGALGCLTAAFVAGHRWKTPGWDVERVKSSTVFLYLWTVCQPVLFGLIGAEVVFARIQPATVGLGTAVLVIGLVVRMIFTMVAVTGSGMNLKEKLFTAIAWIPKATVQAALGSIALTLAREKNSSAEMILLGEQVVTIAVLLIVITAPLGAIAITLTAPRLLQKEDGDVRVDDEEKKNGAIYDEDGEDGEESIVLGRKEPYENDGVRRMIDDTGSDINVRV
ncbi:Mitochondrial sodium/hydrogen exchanger 9B2 [Hypsibius exemplaris]|uniref:Mitochondrial sodium/hydrogen exchanger 9B2 n=1 Tax=Hypsibius exemplaris TaxID=2072580 RepID=A0A9X6NFI5_HYPEX|nr:Mitochondrial sodium/hydrogen exchanger 9B2 [Hypsibius exemplaris]